MQPADLDLTFNPFEDDDTNDEPTAQNRQHFGSAFLPNVQTPRTRRRSSFGASESSSRTIRKRHSRSRTESFNIDPPDVESNGHPLKSAALKSAIFRDVEVTRPHLARIVQSSGVIHRSASYSTDSSSRCSTSTAKVEETEVIVHQITSKDSLAGVSLKYGIPLAELRRANQLWTSDSIHLRRELFIPVVQAKRAHEYLAETDRSLSISSTFDFDDGTQTEDHVDANTRNPDPLPATPSTAESSVDSTLPNIRRIPASQLSFFPPSSNPSRSHTPSDTPPIVSTDLTTQRAPYLTSFVANRVGPSPANSLTSLLTALPIAASTRDEIVSRLSFESVSSSYNDRPPRSLTGSDEGSGHEMGDVHRTTFSRGQGDPDLESLTTKPRPYFSNDITPGSNTNHTLGPLRGTFHGKSLLSTSPPSSYVPQHPQNMYVRTQQLEPSPEMELPSKQSPGHRDPMTKKSPRRTASVESRARLKQRSNDPTASAEEGIELDRA